MVILKSQISKEVTIARVALNVFLFDENMTQYCCNLEIHQRQEIAQCDGIFDRFQGLRLSRALEVIFGCDLTPLLGYTSDIPNKNVLPLQLNASGRRNAWKIGLRIRL